MTMIHSLGLNSQVKRITVDGTNYEKAAGFGDTLTSGSIDTFGFDAVLIITTFGAIASTGTATQTFWAAPDNATWKQMKDANGGATNGNAISLVATGTANQYDNLVIDFYRPTDRYVQVQTVRATANVAIDALTAILFKAIYEPTAYDPNSTEVQIGSYVPVYNHPSY